jgi:hypothetical protein
MLLKILSAVAAGLSPLELLMRPFLSGQGSGRGLSTQRDDEPEREAALLPGE